MQFVFGDASSPAPTPETSPKPDSDVVKEGMKNNHKYLVDFQQIFHVKQHQHCLVLLISLHWALRISQRSRLPPVTAIDSFMAVVNHSRVVNRFLANLWTAVGVGAGLVYLAADEWIKSRS